MKENMEIKKDNKDISKTYKSQKKEKEKDFSKYKRII